MVAAATTKSVMNGKIGDTPAPMTIPAGKWLFEIDDCGVSRKSTGVKAWFNLTPVEPVMTGDDETTPDPQDVEDYTGENGLSARTVFHSYDESRAYECTRFMTAIGVNTDALEWKQISELAGLRFCALVTHDPNDRDPARPWVRLRAFEPYDDASGEAAAEETVSAA